MPQAARPKPLVWIGSSWKDLKSFPEDVQDVFGYALYVAQMGGKHPTGIAMPKRDVELIRQRLKQALEIHRQEHGK